MADQRDGNRRRHGGNGDGDEAPLQRDRAGEAGLVAQRATPRVARCGRRWSQSAGQPDDPVVRALLRNGAMLVVALRLHACLDDCYFFRSRERSISQARRAHMLVSYISRKDGSLPVAGMAPEIRIGDHGR